MPQSHPALSEIDEVAPRQIDRHYWEWKRTQCELAAGKDCLRHSESAEDEEAAGYARQWQDERPDRKELK
jgi:hypothetical protein